MLKINVIADNILNLTDARYFAAFGVDYLVFNVDNISQTAIKEISGWVEGIQVLLEINQSLSPEMLSFIIELAPKGFVSTSAVLLAEMQGQFESAKLYLRESEDGKSEHKFNRLVPIRSLEGLNMKKEEDQKVFIKLSDEITDLETIINSDDIDGIVVEGKPEEKVGFKNFDALDNIFDQLAIEI